MPVTTCTNINPLFTTAQVLSLCGSILLAGGGAIWVVRGMLAKIEKNMGTIEGNIRSDIGNLELDISTVKSWLGSLLVNLEGKINKTALADLKRRLVVKVTATGNPISKEQADKILSYLDRVGAKKTFTPEEASDFQLLIESYVTDDGVREKYAKRQSELDILSTIAGSIYSEYYLKATVKK